MLKSKIISNRNYTSNEWRSPEDGDTNDSGSSRPFFVLRLHPQVNHRVVETGE